MEQDRRDDDVHIRAFGFTDPGGVDRIPLNMIPIMRTGSPAPKSRLYRVVKFLDALDTEIFLEAFGCCHSFALFHFLSPLVRVFSTCRKRPRARLILLEGVQCAY
jgi:hypothetical protein